jgi:RNase adaptor protein for sRNA GlmZ degradation
MIEVGFYSEDAIYGPLYYDFRKDSGAVSQGRALEKELPKNTILLLLTATKESIVQRMESSPHEYQVIRKEDIPMLLKKFEEEFNASTIHAKIKIDTSKMSQEQVLLKFFELARPHLTVDDLIRM